MHKLPPLTIVHLYPELMNTYGDTGNIAALERYAKLAGSDVTVIGYAPGDAVPSSGDIYFFGGGQDAAQGVVGSDLERLQPVVDRIREKQIPLLAICGGYQLLGSAYLPFDADPIKGLSLFPVTTRASNDRMIGNCILTANPALALEDPSTIVGFENHSGKTEYIDHRINPLGTVVVGSGNNGADKTEGCVVDNAIGCYLHGPLLPKNPHITKWLLGHWLRQAGEDATLLNTVNNSIALEAHRYIVERYAPTLAA